jgi:HD-like signal output (HDOD) protein
MPATEAMPGKTLPRELQEAMSRVTEMSSLPEITTRIVEVVEDPRATAHDMHDIVRTDPALAAKILRVVKSAFYGLPSQVASLDRAILLLGLSAVKNLALAASLSRLFNADALSDQFAARDLWRHSVAVAVCSRLLSGAGKCLQADEGFVAGLVHDMGLVVAQQLFPAKLRTVAGRCYDEPQDFCAVEQSVIGADHQAFGAALATKWRFPALLCQAMAFHHDPGQAAPALQKVATLVYVADTVCCRERHGLWLTAQTQEISPELLPLIGLTAAGLDAVLAELPQRIEEAEQVFGE